MASTPRESLVRISVMENPEPTIAASRASGEAIDREPPMITRMPDPPPEGTLMEATVRVRACDRAVAERAFTVALRVAAL
jgi:hypothetical protein